MRQLVRAVGVATMLVAASATGEEPASNAPRRALGEHVFIPRLEVFNPFTTSDVASTSGFAYGTAGGPTFNLDGQEVDLADYQIVAYSQAFSAQWGIADWWAIRLLAEGTSYTGANGSALAGIGVNGVVRGGAGTTFSWRVVPNLRLGLLVDVGFGPSVGISILEAIQKSLAEGTVQTPVHSSASTTITPALSAAWGFARGFGLLVNVSYTHNTVSANEDSVGLDVIPRPPSKLSANSPRIPCRADAQSPHDIALTGSARHPTVNCQRCLDSFHKQVLSKAGLDTMFYLEFT